MASLLKRLKLGWHDYRTDIPEWIASGIGQTAAEWAVIERELEEVIRLLMDADIQIARIAANRMNARTRIITIKSLLESHVLNGTLKKRDRARFVNLTKKVQDYQTKRDMLAHGLWDKQRGSWYVLQTRQSREMPQLRPSLESLSRAVLPQPHKITRAWLRSACRQNQTLAKRLVTYCKHLERALAPLRNITPQYTRRRRDYHR
jgi:hypothetical protein